MATPLVSPKFYAWHPDTGKPLAFGQVYTYEPGSTDFRPTYQDEDATIENANPVPLNAAGYASIFLVGSYRIVVADKDDNIIWEHDPVSDITPEIDEWLTPIDAEYVSPVSFLVSGDQRILFAQGRAVKIEDESEFIAYIESAVYAGGYTTISFYSDQAITAGISSVRLGIVSVAPLSRLNSGIAVAGGRSTSLRRSAIYTVDDVLGGTPDYLDGIDGLTGGPVVNGEATSLQTGDIAFVGTPDGGTLTTYIMDASSGESADGEEIVSPVSNAGLRRWKRQSAYFNMDRVYPVGSIVSLYVDTNPAELYGIGTWALHGVGKVPVCVDASDDDFNEAGLTGGLKAVTLTSAQSGIPGHEHETEEEGVDHTHTGTTSEDGEHSHPISAGSGVNNSGSDTDERNWRVESGDKHTEPSGKHKHTMTTGKQSQKHTHPVSTNTAADAKDAHENMPPFICEYRWRRTA